MSFNFANVKARQEASRRRGALHGATPSVELGLPGGEDGGSGGGVDFSTPGEDAGLRVDSEEEMFAEVESNQHGSAEKQDSDAVKLLFPLLTGAVGMEEEWPWNICGGLIGGARGSRFCTKLCESSVYSHCGVGSRAVHKAKLEERRGYIPTNVSDRANMESAFLEPSIDAARFPGTSTELLGQSLFYEEWIESMTVLPTVQEMKESSKVGHEMMAEIIE
jgi:hypothetical protein